MKNVTLIALDSQSIIISYSARQILHTSKKRLTVEIIACGSYTYSRSSLVHAIVFTYFACYLLSFTFSRSKLFITSPNRHLHSSPNHHYFPFFSQTTTFLSPSVKPITPRIDKVSVGIVDEQGNFIFSIVCVSWESVSSRRNDNLLFLHNHNLPVTSLFLPQTTLLFNNANSPRCFRINRVCTPFCEFFLFLPFALLTLCSAN